MRGGPGWAALPWLALALALLVPIAFFLSVAFSPALFAQGPDRLTLAAFQAALESPTVQGIVDSLLVAASTALLALAIALALAWALERTTLAGRRLWTLLAWVVLISPTFLPSLGWERLLARDGVLEQIGVHAVGLRDAFFGPAGVIAVLTIKGVPFALLAVSASLAALGQEYEDAARVHGASRRASLRIAVAMLAPACWSALAIVFAETISDFGVASTIASTARFPIATQTLFEAIDNFPPAFPVAAAISWFLVGAVALAVFAQSLALKSRRYEVLGGRTRFSSRVRLGWAGHAAALGGVATFFTLGIGVPLVGAVSSSLLKPAATRLSLANLTVANYAHIGDDPARLASLGRSVAMGAVAATLAVVLGMTAARLLTRRQAGLASRGLDLLLLAAVGLPGIVLGAGYIFAYNLPLLTGVGIQLYGTLFLLVVAYLANALPGTARVLAGPLSQIQPSVYEAARVHGSGAVRAWGATVLPLLARSLTWAWLFSFTGVVFELPISQLLYPAGQEPLSVEIEHLLSLYDYGSGTALMVLSVGMAVGIVGMILAGLRLLSPRGWRAVGVGGLVR